MKLIVDGLNLLFRAHHTTGHLTFPDGSPCGAVWGGLKLILQALKTSRQLIRNPGPSTDVELVWDGGRSQRRLAELPIYKAHRNKNKTSEEVKAFYENLDRQAETLNELGALLGFTIYKGHKVEADDVIGFLAQTWAAADEPVVILSNDSDFNQLSHKKILLFQNNRLNGQRLESPLGIHLLEKVLTGDKSDNIPGVGGVGPKTFEAMVELMRAHGIPVTCEDVRRLSRRIPDGAEGLAQKGFESVRRNLEGFDRNVRLIDLSVPLAWEEVHEVVLDPVSETTPDVEGFRQMISALGWKPFVGMAGELNRISRESKIHFGGRN